MHYKNWAWRRKNIFPSKTKPTPSGHVIILDLLDMLLLPSSAQTPPCTSCMRVSEHNFRRWSRACLGAVRSCRATGEGQVTWLQTKWTSFGPLSPSWLDPYRKSSTGVSEHLNKGANSVHCGIFSRVWITIHSHIPGMRPPSSWWYPSKHNLLRNLVQPFERQK